MNGKVPVNQNKCPTELRVSQQRLSQTAQVLMKRYRKEFATLCNRAMAQGSAGDYLWSPREEMEGLTIFPDFPAPFTVLLTWRRWFDEAKKCRVVEVIDFQTVCFNSIDVLRAGADCYGEELDEMSSSRRKQLFNWYARRLLEVASEEDLKGFLKKRIKVSFNID